VIKQQQQKILSLQVNMIKKEKARKRNLVKPTCDNYFDCFNDHTIASDNGENNKRSHA